MSSSAAVPRPVSWGLILLAIIFLIPCCLGPVGSSHRKGRQSSTMQTAHAIGLAMYSYANDNNQMYPDGTSATEVCQKLMDGGYVTDPGIFYIPMPGKVQADAHQKKLKPENICWDFTGGASSADAASDLPILFLTGYKITYAVGGKAVPVIKPYPGYQWSGGGLAVFYKSNAAKFINSPGAANSDYSVNIMPTDFKPDGTVYRQLTPEGVLPP